MEQIRSTPKQQRPQAMQALLQSHGYDGYRVSTLFRIFMRMQWLSVGPFSALQTVNDMSNSLAFTSVA